MQRVKGTLKLFLVLFVLNAYSDQYETETELYYLQLGSLI